MKEGTETSSVTRSLGEYEYFVRSNLALSVIRKVLAKNEPLMSTTVYSRNYFSLATTVSGPDEMRPNCVKVLTSKGEIFLHKTSISDKEHILDKYKVIITYAMSGGNKPTSEGNYQILSSLRVLPPQEACTETYLILGVFDTKEQADNMVLYMSGKLSRFLLLQALTSIHITKDKFCFVPVQDYSNPVTDAALYEKYALSKEEIEYIESIIKEMGVEENA